MPIKSVTTSYVGEASYQMYVECFTPMADTIRPYPLVFVHGGCHHGAYWINRPDGEPGWAAYFCERGWKTYVVDWPGHGRSGFMPEFTKLSTQRVVDNLIVLLHKIGPAILMTHSMSGQIGWKTADTVPNLVRGIVASAPGRPANLQTESERPPLPADAPVWTTPEEAHEVWANGDMYPREWWPLSDKGLMPESPYAMNERRHAGGITGLYVKDPDKLKFIPKVVITGDQDPRHPREMDESITEFIGGDFVWLPDHGMPGHGHMFMVELGNLEIARLIEKWLEGKGLS